MGIKEIIAEFAVIHFVASLALAYLAYALGFYALDVFIANIFLLAIPLPLSIIMALPNIGGIILAIIFMWATDGFK